MTRIQSACMRFAVDRLRLFSTLHNQGMAADSVERSFTDLIAWKGGVIQHTLCRSLAEKR